MVDFIREKTRQYVADQSGAIRQGQMAQNVSDWGNVIQSAGKLGISAAKQVRADRKAQLKLQEEADQQIINTQIGSRAETDLLEWNIKQIQAGVDPSSDEYTQKLYAKRDELYQPYLEQMGSEKGRSILQKQGLDAAEKIRRSNISKVAKNRQQAQAQRAFAEVTGNIQNDAREFGKLGDWEGFKEAIKRDRDSVIKYAKANGNPEVAEFQFDSANIMNYLSGLAESDPETVVAMLDDQESLRDIVYDRIDAEKPGLSDKQKKAIFEDMYKDANQAEVGKEALLEILPESVLNQYQKAFVQIKKAEQLDIKEKMAGLPKGSKAYQALEKRFNDAQGLIDSPEDSSVSLLRDDLKKVVLPIAKEQLGKNRLQQQKMAEANVIDSYTMVLNPDTSVSLPAQMALSFGQPTVEKLFNQSISDEEMHKAYDAYAQAKTNVLQRKYATFEATQGVADKMYDFLSNQDESPIVNLKNGLELLTEMNKSDLTQDQWNNLNNIMYGVLKDKNFADLSAAVLEDNNRYFPDLPLLATLGNATTGSHSIVSSQNLDEAGLPSSNLGMTDIDSVKSYLDKESTRISQQAIAMLGQVAQMPEAEARANGVKEIGNFVATEKKKVYDNAMKSYGIDLAKLRDNKRVFGQAFTMLGTTNPVEYLGDDPYSGRPLFRPLTDYRQIENARKSILDGLEAIRNSKEKKED